MDDYLSNIASPTLTSVSMVASQLTQLRADISDNIDCLWASILLVSDSEQYSYA